MSREPATTAALDEAVSDLLLVSLCLENILLKVLPVLGPDAGAELSPTLDILRATLAKLSAPYGATGNEKPT